MHTNRRKPSADRRAFSIVELIVAVAIISVLVLIITPVLNRRSADAKIRAAQKDMEHLANAQERVFIDTGYMFPFDVLDDVSGEGDGVENHDPLDQIDSLYDEDINTQRATALNIFINPKTGQIDTTLSMALYLRLTATTMFVPGEIPASVAAFGWVGPYLNWDRDVNNNDWPDDPWGNDYLLFSRVGILAPESGMFDDPAPATILNGIATGLQTADIFDRLTILSLGPDGGPGDAANPGDNFGEGDDLVRKFGGF